MQVEVEVVMQGQLLVAHLDVLALTALDNGTGVHRLDDGINVVLEVLNHDGVSGLDGRFKNLNHPGVGKTGDLKVIGLLTLLQPGDTLKLRIDDK